MAAKDGSLPIRKMLTGRLHGNGHALRSRWEHDMPAWRNQCQRCGEDIEMRLGRKSEAVRNGLRWWSTHGHPEIVWIIEGSLSFRGRCRGHRFTFEGADT